LLRLLFWGWMYDLGMAVIHISEADAARDFASLMAKVRAGEEVVIESGTTPVAVMKPAFDKDPSIKATLERMKRRSEERGYKAEMSPEFAADMEEIIRNRKPADRSAWD
jgi:antitoxin (DNA-binding transcriptional repressor) of toxin-antitoxin stability system